MPLTIIFGRQDLPRSGALPHYDGEAIASWTYDADAKTMVSYDAPQAATDKVCPSVRQGCSLPTALCSRRRISF